MEKCLLLSLFSLFVVDLVTGYPTHNPEDDAYIELLMKSLQSNSKESNEHVDRKNKEDRTPVIIDKKYNYPLLEVYLINSEGMAQVGHEDTQEKRKKDYFNYNGGRSHDSKKSEKENDDDVPSVEFRNIISPEHFCPPGTRADMIGKCRPEM